MAGRILQLALVAAPGVLVVFASLDGEFKKQRKLRLEEEYKRYEELNSIAASLSLIASC